MKKIGQLLNIKTNTKILCNFNLTVVIFNNFIWKNVGCTDEVHLDIKIQKEIIEVIELTLFKNMLKRIQVTESSFPHMTFYDRGNKC